MKSLTRALLLMLAFATCHSAQAGPSSMLRVVCDGEDLGAEVSINAKFKGECPIDIQVAPGTVKLKVYKKIDASNERVFEQEIRMGEGVVKKIEATLVQQLTEEGKRLEPERLRLAAKAAAEKKENDLQELRKSFGFVVHADVIEDTRTGLMWVRKPTKGLYDWKNANMLVKEIDFGGYRDWRLPTKGELLALKRQGSATTREWFESMGFMDICFPNSYWSSTVAYDEYFRRTGGFYYQGHSAGNLIGPYVRLGEDGDMSKDREDSNCVIPVRKSR